MVEFIKTGDGYQTPKELAKQYVKHYAFDYYPDFMDVVEFLTEDLDMDEADAVIDARAVFVLIENELDKISEWYENNG